MFNKKKNHIKEIKKIYSARRNEIQKRLNEFKLVWKKGTESDIFVELVFCILTPQSKAKSCWNAAKNLLDKEVLFTGNANQISKKLNIVRFKNNKAKYIVNARKLFTPLEGCDREVADKPTLSLLTGFTSGAKISIKSEIRKFKDSYESREWLVKNVKGLGYKEASHFLRNIGRGEDLAILDRHILKNLKLLGVIKEIPDSISKKKYFQIEKKMKEFAKKSRIPISYLDLVMWCKETGEIFK